MNVWPFRNEGSSAEAAGPAGPAAPENAAAYACDANRRFYVRPLEGGAVWLILPERELRLEKAPGAENRYVAGKVVLELTGQAATLSDPAATYANCKTVPAKS